MELFKTPLIQHPTFDQLAQTANSGALFQPRIVGRFPLTQDGRVILNDGATDRIFIGDDGS